jgi:hypothetical protein
MAYYIKKKRENWNNKSNMIMKDEELLKKGIESYKKAQNTTRLCRIWNVSPETARKILRIFEIPIKGIRLSTRK